MAAKFFPAMVVAIALLSFGAKASAQDPVVIPENGQSDEQIEKDKAECHNRARKEIGTAPEDSSGAGEKSRRGAARGALAGAAVGAVGGAIAGDTGKGAAIGGAAGGVAGGVKQRRRNQQQTASGQQQDTYNRAFSACMETREYTVK